MSYWFSSALCFLAANPGACWYSKIWRFGANPPRYLLRDAIYGWEFVERTLGLLRYYYREAA